MTDNESESAGPAEQAPGDEASAGGCAWCAGARTVLFAVAFAAFAAYVAADFATGGRVTLYLAGALSGFRGRGRGQEET